MSDLRTHLSNSVSNPRILVELDIGFQNIQWLNNGSGIWVVNTNNIYPFADLGLPNYFTTQDFGVIGSLQVDGIHQVMASALTVLSTTPETFFFDASDGSVYVRLLASDSPEMHTVIFGEQFGFSFNAFTPVGSTVFYDGRLLGNPTISKSRDPLFFGRIQFQGGGILIANGDGEFDLFGEERDAYGNEARIKLGYDDLPISQYQRLFTGFIEDISISQEEFSVSVIDKRKQLTKSFTYACTEKNALDAIVEIITTAYPNISYTGTFFDIINWDLETENAPLITIDMQEPDTVINIIQDICSSVFGIFFVTPDNLFSFKVVNITEDVVANIPSNDILNTFQLRYDPTEVISSTRIGYDKNWLTDEYTFFEDTSDEQDVFLRYKTFNQREFLTFLPDLAAATDFSNTILDYTNQVHAVFEITTSLQYFFLEIGDMITVDIARFQTSVFGVSTAEIIGISYNLANATMRMRLRKLTSAEANYDYRLTEDGDFRETESGTLRIVE